MASAPSPENEGGSGFHNLFWLQVVARALAPALVVESGVWKGQGTWALRRAVPRAELHAFDVDLSQLVYRDASVEFHEQDWLDSDVQAPESRVGLGVL